MLGGLTSYSDIRGALGATDNEITDDMLYGAQLEAMLRVAVAEALDGASYQPILDAGQSASSTPESTQNLAMLRLFATYFCSSRVADKMRLAIPELISDGKTQMRRFSGVDFDALSASHRDHANSALAWIKTNIGTAVEEKASLTILALSVPNYDPTTAEGE